MNIANVLAGLFAVVFVVMWIYLAYKLYRVVSSGSSKEEEDDR